MLIPLAMVLLLDADCWLFSDAYPSIAVVARQLIFQLTGWVYHFPGLVYLYKHT